ncbi:uncharacterized protein LOC108194153 isoform X2 [Daucus carota subsp. sativus]|uniref:uncharacterized protein LOC108194153 isoform X2 n=1 Tax=Daucus carota subsp. sativus TaxID=79200 RepID=UPI0007EF3AB9|nr:PREDICTED: uncharacterized protein LOC108194153 isoform X2 [Daucus carota subsp. sativus]
MGDLGFHVATWISDFNRVLGVIIYNSVPTFNWRFQENSEFIYKNQIKMATFADIGFAAAINIITTFTCLAWTAVFNGSLLSQGPLAVTIPGTAKCCDQKGLRLIKQ